MNTHPDVQELETLLRATAGTPGTAAHVLTCERCRRRLEALRALSRARGAFAELHPRPGLRAEVLTAAGHENRPSLRRPARSRDFIIRIAAAIAVLLLGTTSIAVLMDPGVVYGSRSELRFIPPAAEPGDEVLVEYRPAGLIDPPLVLRVRLRTELDQRTYDDVPSTVITRLEQDEDGLFRGSFVLPDSVVYMAAAVETPDASAVDDNFGAMWELVRQQDGRMSAGGMLQKINDHLIRNWAIALATSRELTRLHPDFTPGWRTRYSREKAITPDTAQDSLRAFHRQNLRRLSVAHMRAPEAVDPTSAFELAFYAEILEEPEIQDTWKDWLYDNFPHHPLAQEFRTVDLVHEDFQNPGRLLDRLDSLWTASPAGHQSIAWEGIQAATRAGLPQQAMQWARRYLDVPPDRARHGTYPPFMTRYVALLLGGVDDEGPREMAARLLRHHLAELEEREATSRPAGRTQEAYEQSLDSRRRTALTRLAGLERASGRSSAADSLLMEAAELGWSPEVFRTLSRLGLDGGASDRYAARWAVDPETPRALADSISGALAARLGHERSRHLLDSAQGSLRDAIGKQLIRRPLLQAAHLTDDSGHVTRLEDASNRELTFIAFWSRWCKPSLDQLEDLDALTLRLQALGLRVITISDDGPSPTLSRFLRTRELDMPVRYDPTKQTSSALAQWGTPHYFLVDEDAVVRYEARNLDDVFRVASVLLLR